MVNQTIVDQDLELQPDLPKAGPNNKEKTLQRTKERLALLKQSKSNRSVSLLDYNDLESL